MNCEVIKNLKKSILKKKDCKEIERLLMFDKIRKDFIQSKFNLIKD